jgi:DNA-binding transcriptional MerR regulator
MIWSVLEVNPQPATRLSRADPQPGLGISEAARLTGVSAHTLRYYARAGLVVSAVGRTGGGWRRYLQLDLDWITVCTKLRATGMPVKVIRRYAELIVAGPGNELQRLAVLESHHAQVLTKLAEIQENLRIIDHKIDVYRRRAAGDADELMGTHHRIVDVSIAVGDVVINATVGAAGGPVIAAAAHRTHVGVIGQTMH